MSLYGDLPPPTQTGPLEQEENKELLLEAQQTSSKVSTKSALPAGWASASLRFMPTIQRKPTVQAKPKLTTRVAAISSSPPAIVAGESRSTATPLVARSSPKKPQGSSFDDLNEDKGGRNNQRPQKNSFDKPKKNLKGIRQAPLLLEDDYDPTKPNDYEEYKELEKRRREDEVYRRIEERKRQRSPSPADEKRTSPRYFPPPNIYSSESPASSKTSEIQDEIQIERPPPANIELDISGEEAFLRRALLSNKPMANEALSPKKSPEPKSTPGLGSEDFAHRMLAKYGWQEGQGLGKSEQGISHSLIVQKTDHRSGIIINASPSSLVGEGKNDKTNSTTLPNAESAPKSLLSNEELSRVILLTNMVGPGEVDDTLQEETADECNEKYGTVERCLIFEVPHGKLPDDEAVRIFVKFVEQKAATKAKMDLHGRYFGGRAVTARFFDEGRFDKLELAPSAAELQRARQRDHGSS
ncbi:hypothetical protein G9A89_016574 [Geosiphon pyriformis]|nr:hypothetical protein G9A89_016574 [Geosiphon pyriformis]